MRASSSLISAAILDACSITGGSGDSSISMPNGGDLFVLFFRVSATTVPETADDPDTFCVLLGFRGVSDNVLTTIEEEVPVPTEGLGLMRTILFGLFSDVGGLGPLDSSVT